LVEAAARLTRRSRPEVFLAEPVGSCTDLVATVSYPLRRIYGEQFVIAPLSVLIDPIRAQRVLGLAEGGKFSDKVQYIYRKQLEEADYIVINKCELLAENALAELERALHREFPAARLFRVSARHGTGLVAWFDAITTQTQTPRSAMSVDYAVYAEGEALLGWLNATVALRSRRAIDGNGFLQKLAAAVQAHLCRQTAEVAHLKLTLEPEGGLGDLAVVNLVRNDFIPELSQQLQDRFRSGELIINLRAETSPETLEKAVREGLQTVGDQMQVGATLSHLEFFRPGKPQPTHRFES
jgi:G3E family GTPase